MRNINYYVFLLGVNMVFAEKDGGNVTQKFLNMLKGITDVNRQRMDTLKKLLELEDQVVTKAHLNSFEEIDVASDEDTRQTAIMTILDYLHKNDGNTIGDLYVRRSDDKIELVLPTNVNILPTYPEDHIQPIIDNVTPQVIHEKNTPVKEEIPKEHEEIKGVESEALRKNWMKTVKKKGTRTCIKACKAAHKSFCKIYSCSRKAKKTIRKECKVQCKAKFNRQSE